jgi:hypothetical protein
MRGRSNLPASVISGDLRLRGQLHPERGQDAQNSVELRLRLAAEGAVQVFPGDAGLARDIGHAARAGGGTDGSRNERGIVGLERLGEIFGNRLRAVEVLGRAIWAGLHHRSVLQFASKPLRRSNGADLGRFVSAAEQHHQGQLRAARSRPGSQARSECSSLTPSPTGATSPGLPSASRSIRSRPTL